MFSKIHLIMNLPLLLRFETWELMIITLVLMIISTFIGFFIGKRYHRKSNMDSTVAGILFSLLGLMLAFTFNMAMTRYDMRRATIIEEANNIGTAVLRADLYNEKNRQLLRADFKKYVDARISFFTAGADKEKVMQAQKLTGQLQQQLWERVSKLSRDSSNYVASMQMIPALNSMIDITTTRFYGNLTHLPDPIIYVLVLLLCASAFYIGYIFSGDEKFDPVQVAGFWLLTSIVMFMIIDMDRPRRGLIKLDEINQSVVDLRQMFSAE